MLNKSSVAQYSQNIVFYYAFIASKNIIILLFSFIVVIVHLRYVKNFDPYKNNKFPTYCYCVNYSITFRMELKETYKVSVNIVSNWANVSGSCTTKTLCGY